MTYEPVIGLEIHLQVKTKTKMFSRVRADYFNHEPNTFVDPVTLGLPGALPVPNRLAVRKCIRLALTLDCSINMHSKFDRKNYFYPDLPKGYQISQYDLPIGYEGFMEVDVDGDDRRIRIRRIHLEEDTGKSMHDGDLTLLDFNKAGVPLIEVVTEPDFVSVDEVLQFAKRLRQTVRYLDISDADMEKGQMRFELNMSLREAGSDGLPDYKVEVKNIGSISVLEKVIAFETKRQAAILAGGKTPLQETRGLRDMTGETVAQRLKEDADDYRYFPEPDIPPLQFDEHYIEEIRSELTELPQHKKSRYFNDFGIEPDTAEVIIASRKRAEWFEQAVTGVSEKKTAKEIAKWMIGDLFGLMKADRIGLSQVKVAPEQLRSLVVMLQSGRLSGTLAKQVLERMYREGGTAEEIVEREGLEVVSDESALESVVDAVIAANPKVVADAAKNPNAVKFLLGQVMRETKGSADPKSVDRILQKRLS
ncbi:MAG: Aspartyl/glutamyl-tRNA(Asn/Gln) amidotransferase subunit B [candidate division WS6 bacterium OLB20]|uniref:Aspartyl/glutamyl-tRNA(Asn/Gln) amidotransferase subunit B n=1 Tax=candidate division WS6 bacterium OLB20 TaxID=1617426 RepID=A0A136LWE7_9BACT|nr:MAG: Aspartyl/glutamyl-tRNA(Asn/Gln) amidotransferase subunit B [candidate division WS6 bacterium OLB20]